MQLYITKEDLKLFKTKMLKKDIPPEVSSFFEVEIAILENLFLLQRSEGLLV
jgi:hypothetical protein